MLENENETRGRVSFAIIRNLSIVQLEGGGRERNERNGETFLVRMMCEILGTLIN
jgi:hypothetical protein